MDPDTRRRMGHKEYRGLFALEMCDGAHERELTAPLRREASSTKPKETRKDAHTLPTTRKDYH